jgi:S1-C subfamily serine protease
MWCGVTVKKGKGHGSGFLVSDEGHILTNYHVTGTDTQLDVIFNNGQKYEAKVLRANPRYDLSLLKVELTEEKELTPVHYFRESSSDIGSSVYVIGTPLKQELGQTMTQGVISAKRNVDDVQYLQYDASVNAGNSGGPLINENGQLLGIVNAKLAGPTIEGINFAIPADVVSKALKVKFEEAESSNEVEASNVEE